MALPPIVPAGHPVLRRAAEPVPEDLFGTAKLRQLVATMTEVMHAAPGVGLAAPQIGLGLSLIVLQDAEATMARLSSEDRAKRGRTAFPLVAIANPVLTVHGEGTATFFEGCLSVPGYMALVERALEVSVTGRAPDGQPVTWRVSGWPARILQHEVDHLAGTLYIDRMIARTFGANAEVQARWLALPAAEIVAALDPKSA
jgi:peptide deformylase